MFLASKSPLAYVLLVLTGFAFIYLSCGKPLTEDAEDQLSADCFAPFGANCDWYRKCLEKRYKCEQTPFPYAISFAEHFCLKFDKMYNSFTAKGQNWVDATRKCLQVALVPLLNPSSQEPTCQEIRTFAFNSHTPCYVSPAPQISVCRLPFLDWLRVFHTIKSAFIKVTIPSVQGAIGTLKGCIKQGK